MSTSTSLMALVAEAEPFVMIVHGHRQHLLGAVLADDVLIELVLDRARRGDIRDHALGHVSAAFFLIDDRLAQFDALAADIDVARPFDQGTDVAIAFAAEGAIGIAVPSGVSGGSPSTSARASVFRRHAISFK